MHGKYDLITIGLFLLMVLSFVIYVFFDMIADNLLIGNLIKNEITIIIIIVFLSVVISGRILYKVYRIETQNRQFFDQRDREEDYNNRMDVKDATINNLTLIHKNCTDNILMKLDVLSKRVSEIHS